MNVVIDIETNALVNPTEIWVIVCKDINTGERQIFREVTSNAEEKERFLSYAKRVDRWIAHNGVSFDFPVISNLIGYTWNIYNVYDTLILSKLADYSRTSGHSVEAFGEEFLLPKGSITDWSKYTIEMEEYCIRDVDITELIYKKYLKFINNPDNAAAIKLEHEFQLIVDQLHNNGFYFNAIEANRLLCHVTEELSVLDKEIKDAFPTKLRFIREVTPVLTKHGTLHKKDFRWIGDGDLSEYNGGAFCRCSWEEFNPASHKQIVDVLNSAGWVPTVKTKTHIETERTINKLKRYGYNNTIDTDLQLLYNKLEHLKTYGWKIDEENLSTLPDTAPSSARTLAQRILIEARRRTLTEWLELVNPVDSRIHGKFYGIGAWPHRMAHQQPNTANIPTGAKYLGNEMRSLWTASPKKLLVGVDAESIQLRIFAHYVNDPAFTKAIVDGKKEDKTDPHSFNQSVLGPICSARQVAKRFIYALLLGAAVPKLAEILSCDIRQAKEALERILERYPGFADLKKTVIPGDAKRGWFRGLDGRQVRIPGDTTGDRRHLCMSGYLQNGEAIIMKKAAVRWNNLLGPTASIVNFVHDEYQIEVDNDMEVALYVAKTVSDSLRIVGEELHLNCPMAGSYWNDDHHRYTIGDNWSVTH